MGRRAPRRTGRAYKEVCALDDLYASLARCCGLEVPATLIFDLDRTLAYGTFLRATRFFTRDEREVVRAYERCVFKVIFHNRADHPKNFPFRLGRDRRGRLAP